MEDVLGKIRKQAVRNAAGGKALEQLVLQAAAERKSLREIGAAAGMTPEGVRKMIRRAQTSAGNSGTDGKES